LAQYNIVVVGCLMPEVFDFILYSQYRFQQSSSIFSTFH
jgi:hypothetical protein